jgi:chaperonin GroES
MPKKKFGATPIYDRIIVRRLNEEEKTKGGIIIPDTAKEKPQQAEIIAAGPGLTNSKGEIIPMDIKVGDVILFSNFVGVEISLEGQSYLVMRESDVLGVLEKA